MNIDKVIRDRRIQLGLSDTEAAKLAGLSIHEYCDIEQHHDEFLTAISLASARKVCEALQLNFSDIFREYSSVHHKLGAIKNWQLVQILKEKGISRSDLADKIGFEITVIEAIENNVCYGADLPISVLLDIESCLGMDKTAMIYFIWENCK